MDVPNFLYVRPLVAAILVTKFIQIATILRAESSVGELRDFLPDLFSIAQKIDCEKNHPTH